MKQIASIKVFKFQSFSEMLNWLREDFHNRSVFYQDRSNQLAVFLAYNEKTGKYDRLEDKNVDTFQLQHDMYSEYPDLDSLEDYFDENDQPLDEKFAKDYKIDDFTGEEYIDVPLVK